MEYQIICPTSGESRELARMKLEAIRKDIAVMLELGYANGMPDWDERIILATKILDVCRIVGFRLIL